MGDFRFMTQNSILINFDMDLIIVIVNLEFLNNSEGFIPHKRLPEKFHNKKHSLEHNLEHFGISAQFSLRFRD